MRLGRIMSNEYFEMLTDVERVTVARALLFLVKIDGRLDERERNRMHEIVRVYGLTEDLSSLIKGITQDGVLRDLERNIQERLKKLFVIRELLTLANIDDDLDDTEARFIESVANVLNVEDEKVLDINELVLDRKIWLLKEEEIMNS